MSILKPEGSIMAGLATAAFVYGVYSYALPSGAEVHATQANDDNIERSRKKAAWTSVAAVSGVALLTKDLNIFILGGAAVFAVDWHARHANAASPDSGQVVDQNGYQPAQSNVVPMPVEPPIAGQAAY